jgi:hypothetical protein
MLRRSVFTAMLASIPGLALTKAAPRPARQNKVYWLHWNMEYALDPAYESRKYQSTTMTIGPFGNYDKLLEKKAFIRSEDSKTIYHTLAVSEELV